MCLGVEGVPRQCSVGSHPRQGGQLGLSPGLDGCAQWRGEAEDGCKDSLTPCEQAIVETLNRGGFVLPQTQDRPTIILVVGA